MPGAVTAPTASQAQVVAVATTVEPVAITGAAMQMPPTTDAATNKAFVSGVSIAR